MKRLVCFLVPKAEMRFATVGAVAMSIAWAAVILQISGCCRDPDTRQKLPTSLLGTSVASLNDGEAAWIGDDLLIVDNERYLYIDHRKLSSPTPTHYRVFKYDKKYDLYLEAEHFARYKPDVVRHGQVHSDNVRIEKIIIVDDISSVDLDIAKRLDRLKTVEIALD